MSPLAPRMTNALATRGLSITSIQALLVVCLLWRC
jgi:hypothetical protein